MDTEAHGNFAGKHLVVFGCGYVGGELARQAIARGLRVTALTRNVEKATALRGERIETIVADLADQSWHAAIPTRPDFVLNAVSSGGGGVEGYRRSYLEGMKSVLAWTNARKFSGPFLYTSSTSVYPQDGGVNVDESAPVTPRDERAAVLIETEKLLRAERSEAWVFRLAGIYGPARVNLVEHVRLGEISGAASHHLNLIHRDDICAAIWLAFDASTAVRDRTFNVVDDAPSTKGEVTNWLAERIGVPSPRFTGAPGSGRRAVTPDRVILNGKLKKVLGWSPRFPTYREGYSDLLSR